MPAKYQALAEALRQEIGDGMYNERQLLPTEELLCQRFQLSRQTVRKALSVLESDGLITRRQGSGSHLQSRTEPQTVRNCTVAVVTTYISDYIFPSLLRGMETVLAANARVPLRFATQNQISTERKVLQALLAMRTLDGVLVEGTKTLLPNPNLDLYQELIDRGIKLVFINGVYPELSALPSVLADNRGGGRLLTEYLYQKGHRNIAGIFKSDDMQGAQRYSGYTEALRNLGLPFNDEKIYWYNTEAKKQFFSDSFLDSMLDGFADCTAIVCYNDEVAIRVVTRLKNRGVRVPEEMAVVSFDNSQYSELAPVHLTSLSHGTKNPGELAAEMMLRLLRGEECPSEVVPWQLVARESG